VNKELGISNTTKLQAATLIFFLLMLITSCSSDPSRSGVHESLNATLWSLTGAEYAASTSQAYNIAAANLDLALADSHWSAALEQESDFSNLPPAVLMDIDQTILDNSLYNSRIILEYGEYSQETFSAWCEKVEATAIPGAKTFIDHAIKKNVTVIYYSRRLESLRDCTTENLLALGLPVADQRLLLLNDRSPSTKKAYLRTALSSQYRILLLIGDDLEDFVSGSKTDSPTRLTLANRHAQRWGREWIILPNPMYGAWDTSLYDFDYGMPRDQRTKLKVQHLAE
jgi:5'-nucleotidase (lipoprotein e(P4) family)